MTLKLSAIGVQQAITGFEASGRSCSVLAQSLSLLDKEQEKVVLSTVKLDKTEKGKLFTEQAVLSSRQAMSGALKAQIMSLGNLTEAQYENIVSTIAKASAVKKLTVAEIESMLVNEGLATSTAKEAAEKIKAALATNTLAASNENLNKTRLALMATNPSTWIFAIVAVLSTAIGLLKNYINNQNQAASAAASALNDVSSSIDKYKDEIDDLRGKLDMGSLSQDEANQSRERLIAIQDELVDSYGYEAAGIDLVNGKLEDQIGIIDNLARKKASEYLTEHPSAIATAEKRMTATPYMVVGADISKYAFDNEDAQNAFEQILKEYEALGFEINESEDGLLVNIGFRANAKDTKTVLNDFATDIRDFAKYYGQENNVDILGIQKSVESSLSSANKTLEKYKETYEKAILSRIMEDDTGFSLYGNALDAVERYNDAIASGDTAAIEVAAQDITNVKAALDELYQTYPEWKQVFEIIFAKQAGDLADGAAGGVYKISTSFGNLKSILSGAKESIDSSASSLEQLKSAIGVATDWRSTTQEVSNALRTIQQLTGVKLDIKADGLQDTLQLIKAYIDGDIESFNEMASAAMKSLGVKVDPSNIKAAITQLITMLGTLTGEAQSTATALISIFSSVGAVKKVIDKDKLNADIKSGAYKGGSSQGILDKYYKYVVDDNFFNQVSDTATSSTSSGSSTDPRVEAYEAAIARLDHLRAMDLISEQEYYDGMLKAFNDHLKNKTKYQDQWWKYEEAYYAWRKKQVEESAEAEKKAAKANYDAQKDALDKTKKGYQDELNALKDKINAEKKLLDREADERSHQETVEEINDEIADYNAQIESLMLDDSAKAKAKRLDLEEQKQEALKKLQDEQADWSKQTQENALDDQMDYWENYYGNLIDLVEESLDRIADAYDRLVSSIESSLESTLSALDTQMSQTGTGGFDLTYAKGGSKAAIQETQNALMSSDYSVGNTGADGVWGARTEKAFIMAWQVYLNSLGANLKVDGVRGSQTKAWEKTLGKVFGQRYHTGGVVGKDITADYRAITSLKPDEVPIVAQKGEVVLTADKVAQLANLVKQNKIVANAFKAFLPTARQPAMAGEAPQLSYSAVFHVNGDVDDATVRKLDKVARTAAQEVYSNAIKGLQKTGRL